LGWPERCTTGTCVSVVSVRRWLVSTGLVLLSGTLPACLLFTDPINSAPRVTIVPVPVFHVNEAVTFAAMASDPDGDPVTLSWSRVPKACADVSRAEWDAAIPVVVSKLEVTPLDHQPFCVRVVATDQQGAPTPSEPYDARPENRSPVVVVSSDPPLGASFPLYTSFRLTATPTTDEDGDPVTFDWKLVDGSGADLGAQLTACDPGHPDDVRCFSAEQPGAYQLSVTGSDGQPIERAMTLMQTLTVLDDGPPCIELTDPAQETAAVVMAVTDPARAFEVRKVKDDGNPFPPGPHGAAAFQWFTARPRALAAPPAWSWTKELGYDRSTFDVGAFRFDDVRPGSTYRVRVQVRDPLHQSEAELHDLQIACGDADVCKVPDRCVRWVTWSVTFK
jgi:hypothetical protein